MKSPTSVPPLDASGKIPTLIDKAMERAARLAEQWASGVSYRRANVALEVIGSGTLQHPFDPDDFRRVSLTTIYLCRLLSPADQLTLATLIQRAAT